MTWVAWRQYRTEALIGLAMLVALAAFLVPTGLDRHAAFQDLGIEACLDSRASHCFSLKDQFANGYSSLTNIVGWFNFAPAIFGLLLAAPLVTEFEQRTYRLAWTQSVTRGRWIVVKLAAALVGAAVLSIALTALMTWWYTPLDRIDDSDGLLARGYNFEGVMPFAYTAFALSLALAAGALTRRTLAAIPAAFVLFTIVRLALEFNLRPADAEISEGPNGQLIIDGVKADQFWTYQAVEGAAFLSAAVLLMALTVWIVKRRM
jgi:hypothetical protein